MTQPQPPPTIVETAGPSPVAPAPETMTMVQALNQGLRAAMAADSTVMILGEDVGRLGGVFRVTDGLQAEFGPERVLDTPLAEAGIVGSAIGLAMRGYRPVCEIQFDGFVFPACNQLITQLAKLRYRTAGALSLPVTVRIPYGGGIGAVEHHSESPEAYFAHTAGLRVVTCATPQDAYSMVQQAIGAEDPVVFLEPKRRYWEKAPVDRAAAPDPLHVARVVRAGTDVTLAAYGPMVRTCLDAAAVAEDEGTSVAVIDLRTLSPLDLQPVLDSVRSTGRLVVVHEAPSHCSLSGEIASQVAEQAFYSLAAPVLRVTGFDIPYPPSRFEAAYLPDVERILDAVDRSRAY